MMRPLWMVEPSVIISDPPQCNAPPQQRITDRGGTAMDRQPDSLEAKAIISVQSYHLPRLTLGHLWATTDTAPRGDGSADAADGPKDGAYVPPAPLASQSSALDSGFIIIPHGPGLVIGDAVLRNTWHGLISFMK